MRWDRASAVCGVMWLSACGLRSDPLFEGDLVADGGVTDTDDDDSDESGPDPGPSACDMPIEMPMENITINGTFSGGDHERGWCGQDSGPEQVYLLTALYSTDITLVTTQADDALTLRIVENGCADGTGRTVMCANDFREASKHFFAVAGQTYSIIVDGDSSASGKFSFDVVLGWPTLDQCEVHNEVIVQQSGGAFLWENEFGRGQGTVDGACGGPGRDNMFPISTSYVGGMYAEAYGSDGFQPVLSLRTSCAGLSELTCSAGEVNGIGSLSWYFETPGTEYYLAVDQVGIEGGSYALNVYFD